LRDEAKRLGETDLVVKIFGSVVGVIAVTVLCFVGWSVFKRRYRRWLLGVKPEVASSES